MRKFIILLTCFLMPIIAFGEDELKYDIESAGVSASGTTLVKVSVYVKKAKKASSSMLKKAAVHGIIFRGVNESSVTGFSKQRPLVQSPTAAQEYGAFFDNFFSEGGGYISYATLVESSTKAVKVGKQYRVSATLNVSTDGLKARLREEGIIGRMTDGF